MATEKKKLYYGIDLGTTNSAIAYGLINGSGNFETKICPIVRYGKEGGQESKSTLPSVVYYKKDLKRKEIDSIVGDFAKNQYSKKYGYVMKSVKNYMGSLEDLPLEKDIEDKLPEDVSARILRHLTNGLKNKLSLNDDVKNVIVTIPASFDPDMCKATLKAAELAGFDVLLPNGDYKNILLYEPKAVIYNISNMLTNGELPQLTIDFSTKKNVLVFDLGGGTLDVALYSVELSKEDRFPIIDEIAVGRYTAIGGDTFDDLLAKDLTKRFLDFNGLNESEINTKEINQIMENKAEYLKLELSDKIFNAQYAGNKVNDDEEFELIEMDLYKGYEFETYITKKEIEDVFKPIMGENLKKEDVKNIDNLKGKDIKNIIYPILDVLSKAIEKNGDYNVDAVILNGGMTKFYLIKDRIEKFFNLKPIEVNDPDLSVAKGAAFYQYCLEKRNIVENIIEKPVKTKVIANTMSSLKEVIEKESKFINENFVDVGKVVLNETINLALEKGYVHPLVKAGVELPTGDIEFKDIFYIPKSLESFELPFYMGRGNTTEEPNRKIASRKIKLKKIYPINTQLTLIVNIDKNKNLRLSGYVGDNENDRIEITIDTAGSKEIDKNKITKIATNVSKSLDPKKEIESIKAYGKKLIESKKNKQEIYNVLENIKKQIVLCSNKKDFEKYILDGIMSCQNSDYLKGYFTEIGAIIYTEISDKGKKEFKNSLKNFLSNKFVLENFNNKENIKKSIKAIGELRESEFEKALEQLLNDKKDLYFEEAIISLAKISENNDYIMKNFLEVESSSSKFSILISSVGISFRNSSTVKVENIKKAVKKLLKIALDEENIEAIVSLGKLLDGRFGKNVNIKEKEIEEIIFELDNKYKYYDFKTMFKIKYDIALNLMKGLVLTPEEEKLWGEIC